MEKHSVSRLSYLFAHLHLLSSDSFSSTLLSSNLSLLSASSLLCFSSVHIVGSLTSKLPSTRLAQSTSQYFFALQDLRNILPSTTSYYTTCTKYLPVLLCTSLCHLLQDLHNVLPSTTLYYKTCAKYLSVLVCTNYKACTKSTSQHCFALQDLHKVLPITTWYYKTCTKYSSVLLCTTSLAQNISQY